MKIIATAVLLVVLCTFATIGLAQEQSRPQASPDARTLNDLIDVLKDSALRQQLIGELERLRNEKQSAAQPPDEASSQRRKDR